MQLPAAVWRRARCWRLCRQKSASVRSRAKASNIEVEAQLFEIVISFFAFLFKRRIWRLFLCAVC